MKRWLVRIAIAFGVFLLLVMAMFPTTDLVRKAIAGMTPPGTTIDFTGATLRPWGLRVEGLSIRPATTQRPISIPWVTVSPSLWGFITFRAGRPWTVAAAICLGTIQGSLEQDDKMQVLDAHWADIDIATCLGLFPTPFRISGRTTGNVGARLLPKAGPESGGGEVTLRSAAWAPPLPQLQDVILHADSALVRWTLAGPMLTLTEVRASGSELSLEASGTIRFDAKNRGNSPMRIHVRMTTGPDAPDELVDLLETLPRRGGAYDFLLAGTVDVPRIERQEE
jgi:type II secretion system protein N